MAIFSGWEPSLSLAGLQQLQTTPGSDGLRLFGAYARPSSAPSHPHTSATSARENISKDLRNTAEFQSELEKLSSKKLPRSAGTEENLPEKAKREWVRIPCAAHALRRGWEVPPRDLLTALQVQMCSTKDHQCEDGQKPLKSSKPLKSE